MNYEPPHSAELTAEGHPSHYLDFFDLAPYNESIIIFDLFCMEKTKEQLLARKKEILDFLAKHYQKDPERLNNFIAKYPDYSAEDLVMDPSSVANEVADYEVQLATEQAMEEELLAIEEQLKNLS